jgi:hypothetical protein
MKYSKGIYISVGRTITVLLQKSYAFNCLPEIT